VDPWVAVNEKGPAYLLIDSISTAQIKDYPYHLPILPLLADCFIGVYPYWSAGISRPVET
jgi:hypothetical protein